MVGAVGKHALSGRRFPPECGGLVEWQNGARLVNPHGEVADADVAEVVHETPPRAVDIVLHGSVDGKTELVLHRAERA